MRKVILLTLCMTILVVFTTFAISIGLQKKQMKEQLEGEVASLAAVWSTTILPSDIQKVIENQNVNHPVHKKLVEQVSILHEKSSSYLHSMIILPHSNKNQIFILASSRNDESIGWKSFSSLPTPPDEYINKMKEAVEKETFTKTNLYDYQETTWITAFAPIMDENDKVVALLDISADASNLQSFQKKIAFYLVLVYFGITGVLFFIFSKGYKKLLQPVNKMMGEMDDIIQKTKLLKELQRAEKMNAIGQLAASVAHEIRNPMTVVKGFLQIFLAKKELTAEEHMYIKLMIDEMNRAETIINDYLSLAKPGLEQMEVVNAGEMANKVMDLMNSYAMMSNNIEMQMDIEENVFIRGNRSEIQQVLINILKNGIESMIDGGALIFKVYKNGKYGTFEIIDTGIGMTQEELERLGTAFYSLKEKGTGIGLMVSYQIIERMKGNIDVTSEKGVGTTFRISIPLDSSDER